MAGGGGKPSGLELRSQPQALLDRRRSGCGKGGVRENKGLRGRRNVVTAQVAQMMKSPPAKQETRVRSLCQEGPQEEAVATHSSLLA